MSELMKFLLQMGALGLVSAICVWFIHRLVTQVDTRLDKMEAGLEGTATLVSTTVQNSEKRSLDSYQKSLDVHKEMGEQVAALREKLLSLDLSIQTLRREAGKANFDMLKKAADQIAETLPKVEKQHSDLVLTARAVRALVDRVKALEVQVAAAKKQTG